MRHAVIGIGSNSTRMVIGDTCEGRVSVTQRLREGTRLFAGLEGGVLSEGSMLRTADAVARFVQAAQADNVASLHLIATSASRDAKNGAEFAGLVEAVSGVPLQIISGEEEARLSFIGATGPGFCGMVDIGGGSTEIATGGAGHPLSAASAQLGAVRLQGEVPILLGDGLERAMDIVQARVRQVYDSAGSAPESWYGVGGTVTCMASIDLQLPAYDREVVNGHVMRRETVENWARRLAYMPAAEREKLPGMLPTRVDIIAHGAVILWGVMEAVGIAKIQASNQTNLDGFLLEIAQKEVECI